MSFTPLKFSPAACQMPTNFFFSLILGFLVITSTPPFALSESPNCLAVYREGGAPAVFESPKCPLWTFPSAEDPRRRPTPSDCQLALNQGRRRYQEDRALCALDIKIPFLVRTGIKEITVGIIAVLDGHNGAEASDMASKLLLDYFLLHTYFLLDVTYSVLLKKSVEMLSSGKEPAPNFQMFDPDSKKIWSNFDLERFLWISPVIFDEPFHLEILKEALLRTIHDIDATFSKESIGFYFLLFLSRFLMVSLAYFYFKPDLNCMQEALRRNLVSGSTATVVLLADSQILAANVGDSKSLLCSLNFHSSNKKGNISKLNRRRRHSSMTFPSLHGNFELAKYDGPTYSVKELTEDHHPDRANERNRVEAAGGYVLEWAGVPRVNGELAISRAIGDIPYKRYGVISTPEVTEWLTLTSNDSYVVAASDGVFEKMTTQEVCDVLWDENLRSNIESGSVPSTAHSLADYIIKAASEKGTVDNMAAVVLPLGSTGISEISTGNKCYQEEISASSSFGLQKILDRESANNARSTSLMPMEFYNQIIARFNRLLVEAKRKSLGCFYLFENLDEDFDYVFRAPMNYENDEGHEFHHLFSDSIGPYHSGGSLDLYKDQKLCWHFGIHDGDRGQCTSPEVFANFVGLLDSLPYSDTQTDSTESGYCFLDFRYVLKRKFDRGSYGEVWLAFYWNCSQDYDAFSSMHKNFTRFSSSLYLNPHSSHMNTHAASSDKNCAPDSSEDNLFILKRIMVERGHTAYLSGLREKYFGEIFLNASIFQGLTSTRSATGFTMESHFHSSDEFWKNTSDIDKIQFGHNYSRNYNSRFSREEGLNHIARFVEYFESKAKEIWLVFRNEGISLSKLIYTAEETKTVTGDGSKVRNVQVLRPSAWWHRLRTTRDGEKDMQNLIRQLLLAVKSCHDRNITHRDIKPENMIVCFEDVNTGRCSREIPSGEKRYHLQMRIIDFGSAIDEFTLKHLYGSGPTRSEQTFEYTPPEALLNASWFLEQKSVTLKYDMWSIGVVMLELILGSPHIFQISDRTRALLDQHLDGWSEHTKELAYKLRSYMEMCILIPGVSPRQHQNKEAQEKGGIWLASWKCSEEYFSHQVKSRDPLKLGFPNVWALRLVRQLLLWHPEDRLSVNDALSHPYFQQHS